MYAGRAVLPYLLVANLRSAGAAMAEFTSLLGSNGGASGGAATAQSQSVSSATADARIYPSLPLLNFLTLLLLAVRRGRESADLFRQLVQKYRPQLDELDGAWDEALEMIAEMYFGIARPRKSNPLLDMMGSLFGGGGMGGGMGGGPGAGAQQQRRTGPGRVDAPAAEGLD